MMDVPRNSNGWPTISPKYFTLPQLINEAKRWRNYPKTGDTVGKAQWYKYTNELLKRGFSTRLEIQERVLPDEVQRLVEPSWWSQIK